MGLFELEGRVKRLESRWNKLCCFLRACLGISSTTGDPNLVLNQQGDWVAGGGGGSYYLYNENYDSGTFESSIVSGLNSVSIGGGNTSSSTYSTVIGYQSISSGEVATAIGITVEASGNASIAGGWGINSKSVGETSFGIYNTTYTPISVSTPEPTDRIFNIGNGISSGAGTSDAVTVLKNAKVGVDIDNFETTTSLSKLQVNGIVSTSISTINSNIILTSSNITSVTLINNSANSINIKLPNPASLFFSGMSGRLSFKLATNDSATFPVEIKPFSTETIDGLTNYIFTTGFGSIDLVTNGTNWYKI
jgi:hypothetical protein